MHDLRSAFRHLLGAPGFSAVAIVTLALALGVNSAIFSLVNGLLLRPAIMHEPDRVVSLYTAKQNAEHDYRQFSFQELQALREASEAFSDATAVATTITGIGDRESIRRGLTFFVPDNFFSFSGVQPAAGRFFTVQEATPNADIPVVVASHALWQRHGGGADFIGSTVRVNGRPHTVVGIAPAEFAGISVLFTPEVWLPLGMFSLAANPFSENAAITDLNHPKNYTLNVSARLRPGLTLDAARTRLPVLDARLNALLPAESEPRTLQITPPSRLSISDAPTDDSSVAIVGLLLCCMAGIVLLVASLNLANLLLARSTSRAREIAVRLAVGATRWQIVRQLSVEGLILALLGGALGLILSGWVTALLESSFQTLLAGVSISLSANFQPDVRVLSVTFGFCLLATLVFSVGPAWRAAQADLVHDLKAQAGELAGAGRFNRLFAGRNLLVMVQLALSLVLVFASGLFFRGALNAGGMDLGFRPEGALIAGVDYSLTSTPQNEGLRRILTIAERTRAMPGVTSAGWVSLLPYGNISNGTRVMRAENAAVAPGVDGPPAPGEFVVNASISPGYLDALDVRLLRGRDFSEIEAREKESPPVAIIDEVLARKLFPGEDALGRQIRYTQRPADGSPAEMTIVGICRGHRQGPHDELEPSPRLYVPLGQNYSASVFLCVRLAEDRPAMVAAAIAPLRQLLRAVDPEVPLMQITPFTDVIAKCVSLWIIRLGAVMFGVFGGIALILATVGVYGVKAFAVSRRRREIGIRMALGASHCDVIVMLLKQGLLHIAIATTAGVGLALLVGQALAHMLYQVSPTDPLVLTAAATLLGTVALLACWVPARRATRVDPNVALRAE